ncbi:SDR family NAD(P)-dependent oxidoreductase [Streptomyces sp. 049-1]|uniref:SDR family NAD(P)-dependent oxidoreductase n=1 Tax=Streptomyces sp. 049-1 TaxID=2789264 RepID=UPI00398008FA
MTSRSEMMSVFLKGKVALVTGAGRGIGQAVALALAAEGARVAVVARSAEELSATTKLVEDLGGIGFAITADLSDPLAVAHVVERTSAALGPVDVLVNNAATVEPLGRSCDMDPGLWGASFRLNVITPATLSAAVLPPMSYAGWGRIVNVSSGLVARPATMIGGNAYAATKAALEAHTLNLATELDGTGVTANVYRPGSVDTAMQALIRLKGDGRLDQDTHARFVHNHEHGNLITPEESARSLVDRLAGNATGEIWDVADSR